MENMEIFSSAPFASLPPLLSPPLPFPDCKCGPRNIINFISKVPIFPEM